MLTHIIHQPQARSQRPRIGRSAKHLEDNRSGKILQKKNAQPAIIGKGVVQRAIVADIHDNVNLPQEETDKLNAVKQHLDTSLQHFNGKITQLILYIVHMPGKNPASTRLNNPKTAIIVTIGSWFLKVSSIGDICGMVSHEIGVHTLATDQMREHDLGMERHFQKQPFTVKVGLHHHTVTPWDNDVTSRQRDHINVVRDKGGLEGPVSGVLSIPQQKKGSQRIAWGRKSKSSKKEKEKQKSIPLPPKLVNSANVRMEQYAATMLGIGDAIYADNNISPTERDKRIHDLLNSFLFDYARILVTDDLQWHVMDKAPLVAQVYNWYKGVIIARHGNNHQWLRQKSMQPTSSTWGLRAYLLAKVGYAIAVQISEHNKVQKVMMRGGQVMSKIGTGISYVTPNPVKKVVKGVGSAGGKIGLGLWSGVGWGMDKLSSNTPGLVKKGVRGVGTLVGQGLRGVDYLYGETENLVLPPLVKGATSLVKGGGKVMKGIGSGLKSIWNMIPSG